MDLAGSLAPYQMGDQFTQNRIIVNHEYARPFKTSHMNVTIGASIARFAIGKSLAADRTEGVIGRHRKPSA